ncbi:hypothetical protein PAMP_007041 [Pampus punctatissimus]
MEDMYHSRKCLSKMDRLPLPTSSHDPPHSCNEEEKEKEEGEGTAHKRSTLPFSEEGDHYTQCIVKDQWTPTEDALDRENGEQIEKPCSHLRRS